MHTWSIFDEPPPEFIGYFDVVHVRLITVVVTNDDPTTVLPNLSKLLKPGGFFQWDEVDSIGCYVKMVPLHRADSLERLLRQLGGKDVYVLSIARELTKSADYTHIAGNIL
jgi:hypothetical protein